MQSTQMPSLTRHHLEEAILTAINTPLRGEIYPVGPTEQATDSRL